MAASSGLACDREYPPRGGRYQPKTLPGRRFTPTVGLSRNHAVRFGEHTRPRVFRPAPSPVGTGLAPVTKR